MCRGVQLVVVEQDVLQRSFGGAAMTVAEATLIADAALEHTVRAILDALLAPEILKSTRGAPPTAETLQPVRASRSLTVAPAGGKSDEPQRA